MKGKMSYVITRPDGKMYLGTSRDGYENNWTDSPSEAFSYTKEAAQSRIDTFTYFFKDCTVKQL